MIESVKFGDWLISKKYNSHLNVFNEQEQTCQIRFKNKNGNVLSLNTRTNLVNTNSEHIFFLLKSIIDRHTIIHEINLNSNLKILITRYNSHRYIVIYRNHRIGYLLKDDGQVIKLI
jgi:hypothetical protein